MITMKEMVERFKPILNRVEDKKETFEDSIKIPYSNLEQICGEFAPGECYTFFGGAKDNALDIWRLNLMWQLAKNGVPIHILEGGREFQNDFDDLLCLQTGIDRCHLRRGVMSAKEFQALSSALTTLRNYPITWHSDEDVPPQYTTAICMKTVSLEDWQHYETGVLWPQAQERSMVLFLFVKLPEDMPISWTSIYARNQIILPEEASSYLGLVDFQESYDFKLTRPQQRLRLQIKKTDFLKQDVLLFNYQADSRMINEP